MLTENSPRLRMAVPVALPSRVQNSSMQGSSDTDVSELIVAPYRSPSHSVAITATPVGKAPITDRKRLGSITLPCICPSPPQHVVAEFAGVGEVGHPPTVEIVFSHAVFGEPLETIGIAGSLRAEQAVAADLLRRAAIVDLVKLVP